MLLNMMLLLLLSLSFLELHATTKEVEEATNSIRSLIAPLLPGNKKERPKELKDFRVDKCQTEKVNWTDILLMRSTVTLVYKFQEGCDVEGTVVPKIFTPFPLDLKLRKLENYNRAEAMNTVGATIESKPHLTIEMREGKLHGQKGIVKFEADYKVQLDPMNKQKRISKNYGGEVRISEIYGKKVEIKEKILVE
jgi:hypothetical protein